MSILIFILIILAILGSIPLALYMDAQDIKKQIVKDKEWLRLENLKSKFYVELTTIDDKIVQTTDIDPYNTCEGSDWNMRVTSESGANKHMRASFERGYFVDNQNNNYPACNIKKARVCERSTSLR